MKPCFVDCQGSSWNSWEPWKECTVTCGTGFKSRQRTCKQNPCTGSDIETQICNTNSCTGSWNSWQPWNECSVTCGTGMKQRRRTCTQNPCTGHDTESLTCNTSSCPVTPEWDNWSTWTSCSVTCGDGVMTRVRECKKGRCVGNKDETVFCQEPACPAPRVTPTWNAWNPWGPCSATCGTAEKIRTRTCSGSGCSGSSSERGMCRVPACPQSQAGPPTPAPPTTSVAAGTFGMWGAWSRCDATCGYGTTYRTRMCQGGNCIGGNSETRRCILTACQGCNLQLDLVIIVDSSGSIEDKGIGNWEIIKTFVNDLIQVIQVGPDATKVAVIKFSNGVRVWFNLDRYKNKTDMFNAVTNMPYSGGETNTQLAINTMRTDVFSLSEGDRPDIPNACVIITDGESNIRETNTIPEANRAKQAGVNILTVGVTDEVNDDELEGMASRNNWVFRVNNFDRLHTILEGLMEHICTVGKEEKLTSWGQWGSCSRTCGPGNMARSRSCVEGTCTSDLTETKACQIAPCTESGKRCNDQVDICFVVDSSGSIEQKGKGNWNKILNFVSSVVEELDVSDRGTRVSLIRFSNEAEIYFDFNKYTRKDDVIKAVKGIPYWSGGTNTQGALNLMHSQMYTQGRGDRRGIDNVAIVITDGESTTLPGRTIPEANEAKNKGIIILSIGVTNSTNTTELRGMATRDDYVFEVTDFDKLSTIINTVAKEACTASVATYGQWSAWGVCTVTCGNGAQVRSRTCSGQSCSGPSEETRACGTPCRTGPVCSAKADVSLVIDSSGSINQKGAGNWDLVLSFLSDLVRGLPIGPDKMRVGAIIFSEESEILFDLNKYTDANTMAEDIKKIRYLSGGTNTQAALKLMREGFFIRARGDRDGVDNICITLTDGESNIEAGRTIPEALLAKAAGIKMLAIGVTNSINKTELRAIASKEEYVTEVTDFGELQTVLDTILQQTCKVVEVATYGPWSAWGVCSVTCGSGVQERARTCSGQSCSGHSRETRSCGTPCPKGPVCSSKADISLVIDSSGSINQKGAGNWDLVLSFLSDLVRGLPIGPDKMRVGAIIFSEDAEILFDFNKYTDSISMAEDIRKVRYLSGGTNTQAALKLVRERLFVPSRGDRNGVDNICIVLTDGESNIQAGRTVPEALLAKAAGIKMLAIGVTNSTNQTELRAIASKDEFVTEVTDFGELETVLNTIVQQTCEAANVVEGKWNAWGEWCDCSATCGPGIVSRKRTCQTTGCQGQTKETKTCFEVACNTLAQWGPWTQWCPCTVTCGQGAQVRSRECRGSGCTGNSRESRTCQDQPCGPSGWGSWASWTACSRTCGQGSQTRVRSCPTGQTCPGTSQETKTCQVTTCLPLVSWGQWNFWTRCSASCGRGTRRRSRTCSGQGCPGTSSETSFCDAGSCPGSWAAWQSWSACSVSCGGGRRSRERSCQGSGQCEGNSREDSACNTNPCQLPAVWSSWQNWVCSVTCGSGTRTRSRRCVSGPCRLERGSESGPCSLPLCQPTATWSEWSVWQTCSVTCGVGTTRRERSCSRPGLCSGVSAESRTCFSRTCPGSWSEWSFWQSCSATCGQGVERRLRECSRNNVCSGITEETRTCFLRQCPTVSQWSQWGNWGSCSVTCGNGQETARRFCQGGSNCPGDSTVTRACVRSPCAPAAQWGVWGSWGQCSATCGGGQQTRRRSCLTGNNCGRFTTQNQPCNTAVCPVSRWSDWSGWAQCSASCGGGQQTRQRRCLNGFNCPGNPTSSQACNTAACIAQWSLWGSWGACSASCGSGRQSRSRSCQGFGCVGDSSDSRNCQSAPCVVNWQPWTPWGACPVTCGQGTRARSRICPSFNSCPGNSRQTDTCSMNPCPVVSIWGSWSTWTQCSATCGSGNSERRRSCTSGQCQGVNYERQTCVLRPCATPAQWGPWTPWGTCSVSCGLGRRTRTRTCSRAGACTGQSQQTITCNNPCVAIWTPWTPWNNCPVTCGGGQQLRTRTCNGANCLGNPSESKLCNTQSCGPTTGIWTFWYPWSRCDVTCGTGRQTRTRLCPLGGCVGSSSSTRSCSAGPCAVQGTWSPWAAWSPCTNSCGGGTRSRTRTCSSIAGCGAGSNTDSQTCNTQACPAAMWLGWSHWSSCSASCSAGSRTRSRSCSAPTGCRGFGTQNEICYLGACTGPSGGTWASWSGWSSCSVTCGNGIMNRARVCAPTGSTCTGGSDTESSPCLLPSCSAGGGSWTQWGACSVTCAAGTRERLCDGSGCPGPSQQPCNMGPCVIAAVTGQKGAVNDIKSCGGSLSAGKEYKNLTSSGFGEDSGDPVSDKCTWTISAPEGHIVQMNMVELEIDCVEEYWSLGERIGGPFELHACGEKEKVTAASRYATRGKTAVVVYRSVVSNRRLTGFRLHYKAVPIPQTCSEDRQTMPDKNGIIHSPNFGADTVYPVDNTCSWLITTQTGSIVELSFPKFDVTCDDHVIAYSGDTEDKPIKGRVCSPQNSTKDMFLYSSTNKMLLTFVSRGHKVGGGFIAVYRGANPGSSLVLKKKASMTKAPTDVIEDGLDRKLKELEHEWDYVADCGKLSRDGKIGKWHVTIRHKEKIICSGAILSSKSIVTTASCVFNRTTDRYLEARHLTVHVGLKQRSSNNTMSYIASVIGHPGFDKNTGEKDIALLKLKSALSFSSTVGPICLPGLLERETVRCKAVGFLRNDKTLSTLLMDVSTRKKCISTHPDLKLAVTEGHLCVGNGTKFTGSCVGDMGSSIVCDDYGRFHLQALSLWSGADCINRPSVYLNVGTYREWLKMHIFQ